MRSGPAAGKRIAVIGGDPGGLMPARRLQRRGADVTVYERDRSRDVRVQGAALDLHRDSSLAALRATGLMDAFLAYHRPGADLMRIVGSQADIVSDQHEGARAETVFEADSCPEIDRDRCATSAERVDNGWVLRRERRVHSLDNDARQKIDCVTSVMQKSAGGLSVGSRSGWLRGNITAPERDRL